MNEVYYMFDDLRLDAFQRLIGILLSIAYLLPMAYTLSKWNLNDSIGLYNFVLFYQTWLMLGSWLFSLAGVSGVFSLVRKIENGEKTRRNLSNLNGASS